MSDVPVLKVEDAQPVPPAWRPTLREVVRALVEGDYSVTRGIPFVAPVGELSAEQMRTYVASYGETLVELPDESWDTSLAQWAGTRWDVFVDLWTRESGPSDLVLHVNVVEAELGFRFELHALYIP